MFLVRKPYLAFDRAPTLGARGFSCAVSGLGQVLESDPREPFVSSACGRRNEAPRRMREKTSGTQGTEHQAIARQSAVSAESGPDLAFPPPPTLLFKKNTVSHQDILRFYESRTISQIPKMPP